ncbi:regulating synaptic membrane exocytosis protein 2-like, partial [Diaphorina citri]|uniref:Regulating synaptic membrane exocytosis protein 2-like n=1 Tax=Diaphorina citri TaxID=121845 RepID=A0A3Q0JH37_DIACI
MCLTEGMVTSMAQTNADIIPDLSHLTLEERQIIESVMMRQKQEEERELEIMRRKQDEVHLLEQSIRQRSEQQKKAGVELDATCHICLKTKFADGVGHMCNYCNIRCCARCGGKVTLRSNKVSVEVTTRAHSASEKENQPMLTRNNSGLRRQYSQQETTPYRIPSSDSGVDMRHSTAR